MKNNKKFLYYARKNLIDLAMKNKKISAYEFKITYNTLNKLGDQNE